MDGVQVEMLTEALTRIAEAIEELSARISEDEPLSDLISKGLNRIANGIIYHDEGC